MARYYGSLTLIDDVTVLTGLRARSPVLDVGGYSDILFTWLLTGGGSGTWTVYISPLSPDDPRLESLNLTTNLFWTPRDPVIPDPDGVLTRAYGDIGDAVIRSMIVEYVATTDTTGLTLLAGFTQR